MRRFRHAAIVMSITAISVIIGACASTEEVDENLNGIGQEKTPTLPQEPESKIPAASNPSGEKDASAPKDASTPKDSSTPPTDAGQTNNNTGDCDPSDPLLILKLALVQNPTPCPCSASECCLTAAQVCLPNGI